LNFAKNKDLPSYRDFQSNLNLQSYYEDDNFAEVFVSLKRSPEGLKDRIRAEGEAIVWAAESSLRAAEEQARAAAVDAEYKRKKHKLVKMRCLFLLP
jgi:hypothetical protein